MILPGTGRGTARSVVEGLAVLRRAGAGPVVVFLPGFMSDMRGAKAEHLDAWAARRGQALLRFDYSGCGASGGDFADGTISRWTADAAAVIAAHAPGKRVLVGSSMGGWIALLLARANAADTAGVLLLAAAPDFTRWGVSDAERAEAAMTGGFARASGYGGDYRYTQALLADGEGQALLDAPIGYDGPVTLIQGQADPDVPWAISLGTAERLTSTQVKTVLVKDGDHRLSRPADLARMTGELDLLLSAAQGEDVG